MPLTSPTRNYVETVFTLDRILTIGDAFQLLISNDPLALNITVPPDVFGEGVQISVLQFGVGIPTFVAGGGVTLNTASTLAITVQFGIGTLIKLDDELGLNQWLVTGAV